MKLVLIRGLPGSGKSTKARSMTEQGFVHVEADMYHYRGGNGYQWKAENNAKAHEWCLNTATYLLASGADVVVSNTFTRRWEMEGYKAAAKACGAEIEIICGIGKWKNIHNVPEETIKQMTERWEA